MLSGTLSRTQQLPPSVALQSKAGRPRALHSSGRHCTPQPLTQSSARVFQGVVLNALRSYREAARAVCAFSPWSNHLGEDLDCIASQHNVLSQLLGKTVRLITLKLAKAPPAVSQVLKLCLQEALLMTLMQAFWHSQNQTCFACLQVWHSMQSLHHSPHHPLTERRLFNTHWKQ